MEYKSKRKEQETHIRWDAEERIAHIYTANSAEIKKLDTLVRDYPDTYVCLWEDGRFGAKKYKVCAKYIRYGKPASEARRRAARANGKAGRF